MILVCSFMHLAKSHFPQRTKLGSNLQGSDCVAPFKAMQHCMVKHPQAFAEYVQAKDADSEQKASAIGLLRSDQ